jgi:hypothetical protein
VQGTRLKGTRLQGTTVQGTNVPGVTVQGTSVQGTSVQGTPIFHHLLLLPSSHLGHNARPIKAKQYSERFEVSHRMPGIPIECIAFVPIYPCVCV